MTCLPAITSKTSGCTAMTYSIHILPVEIRAIEFLVSTGRMRKASQSLVKYLGQFLTNLVPTVTVFEGILGLTSSYHPHLAWPTRLLQQPEPSSLSGQGGLPVFWDGLGRSHGIPGRKYPGEEALPLACQVTTNNRLRSRRYYNFFS